MIYTCRIACLTLASVDLSLRHLLVLMAIEWVGRPFGSGQLAPCGREWEELGVLSASPLLRDVSRRGVTALAQSSRLGDLRVLTGTCSALVSSWVLAIAS